MNVIEYNIANFLKDNIPRWFSLKDIAIIFGIEVDLAKQAIFSLVAQRRANYYKNYRGEMQISYLPELATIRVVGRNYC